MPQIKENMVVTFEYTLKNDSGEVLDSSRGNGPLTYIQGMGHIIPGLEAEMAKHSQGDKFTASIEPEDAYGVRNEEMITKMSRSELQHIPNLEVGMQLEAQNGGNNYILTVTSLDDENVVLDGNHPLAGERLHFDVEISEAREATEEEISAMLQESCSCGCDDHHGGGCGDPDCCC